MKRTTAVRMETKRLILRSWESVDLEDFMSFYMDKDVMLTSGAEPARDRRQAKEKLDEARKNRDAFAIVLKENGRAVGKIKFQNDIRRYNVNSISVGYELAKAYWGRGIMPEALKAMICYAFEEKRVDVIGIGHFSVNDRSRRVIEKCGFKHEGTIRMGFKRYDGKIFDDESYSITRREYLEGKAFFRQDNI